MNADVPLLGSRTGSGAAGQKTTRAATLMAQSDPVLSTESRLMRIALISPWGSPCGIWRAEGKDDHASLSVCR